MKTFKLNGNNLDFIKAMEIVKEGYTVTAAAESIKKVAKSRELVEKWIKEGEIIYGINTGFGEFKDVVISKEQTKDLQRNLIVSHSAGVGDIIEDDIVRLMILFRINSLIKGHSGVRTELIHFLIKFFNKKLIPQIPQQGSVGCSGDLAPLAHLAGTFIGEGEIKFKGRIYKSAEALKRAGLKPFVLSSKEGLALINGTQMMSAFLCKAVYESVKLVKSADITAAITVDATKSTDRAYEDKIQKIRPHKGQIETAYNLRKLLAGSEIMKSHETCSKVQDAYSIRCIPQVHGAVKDALNYCIRVLNTEINSVTDNPLIFADEGQHREGGNFHGEPLALASDFLKIAISELGNISERRTARLVDGSLSGLPRFLTEHGGLNSGFMIAQYTAASLVSENKALAHPASVDSIPTSANQEDHNSMGSIASRMCYEIAKNVKNILAIEILCACQALDFLKPLKPGRGVQKAHEIVRKNVKFVSSDTNMSGLIDKTKKIVFGNDFCFFVEKVSGKLKY
ncbi:MAG: histidine ammonia-lyase [Bacteroidetes bacterium]|nr:histidine ammonia-lyase [Bacteroidota bacterium]